MKCKLKKILISLLFLLPINAMALSINGESEISLQTAILFEMLVSIHVSKFLFEPLSKMISIENSKRIFWIMFFIRIIVLIIFDFCITPNIFIIDFFAVFIGAFLIHPLSFIKAKIENNEVANASSISLQNQVKDVQIKCTKCNTLMQTSDKFCPNCGEPFQVNNVVVAKKITLRPASFDPVYSLPENLLVEKILYRELENAGIDKTTKLIPSSALKTKKILNVIYSILLFLFVSLIFFHFPVYTYVIGLIILFILFRLTRKFDLIDYLKKQLKARPQEKISNIVMTAKNTLTRDNTKPLFLVLLLVAVISPLIIFSSPKILYEKTDGGYAVRYYVFGLNNFKTAVIPEYYKNEKVVTLRGNTFSNMPFLESVKLPNSITQIRGQAFKNCRNLKEVNMPKNLNYLGGGAFYNAKSIKSIALPDTLTYMGGEVFYGASSLELIKLSNNLKEIRGNSFENCTSLKSITIPDSVTRIGGHAFYGDSSLSEVLISENSELTEIGSSAFRKCTRLYSIIIPRETYVNERAFKESPTVIQRYDDSGYSSHCYFINGVNVCRH